MTRYSRHAGSPAGAPIRDMPDPGRIPGHATGQTGDADRIPDRPGPGSRNPGGVGRVRGCGSTEWPRVAPGAGAVTESRRGRRVTERQLIDRVLGGDRVAEREFYDRHVDRVYRLAYRLADSDPDLARDFTQDVFIRAFDRLCDFRGEARISTWLHSITVSVALNGMRKVRRWRMREAELTEVTASGAAVTQSEPGMRSRLRAAIRKLPEKYRLVFVMYDVEGYTHEEIGATLGMPTGTSKARLSRARAKLRAELAEYAGEWAS